MHSSAIRNVRILFERGHLRQAGTPTLFAAVVLLLSAMALLGVNITELRRSYAVIQRSNATLLEIAEVDAKLVGVEMTVRGYALTDDPKFLRYQHYERSHTMTAMDKLAQLVADQPAQMRRLELLRGLVAKRLALYSQLSGLGPGHASDVAAAITDPKKRDDMLSARLTLQAMRDDQLKLLASRQATVRASGGAHLQTGLCLRHFGIPVKCARLCLHALWPPPQYLVYRDCCND